MVLYTIKNVLPIDSRITAVKEVGKILTFITLGFETICSTIEVGYTVFPCSDNWFTF